MNNSIELTLVKPDFAQIKQMLTDNLVNYPAWKDLSEAGTGTALINFIAAVGANDQYAIQHAFRETFRTARLDSSILAQAALLGVRLDRKRPALCEVELVSPHDITIPKFSQFSSTNRMLFNRETIELKADTPLKVSLYEGVVKKQTLTGTGLGYQLFTSQEMGYTISDEDVEVQINGIVVKRSIRGLWSAKDAYQDSTTPEGQMMLLFGAHQYGIIPPTGSNVAITYVTTSGSAGNDTSFTGTNVVLTFDRQVQGKATTLLSGGGDERPISLYRRLTPQLFSAKSSASTADELPALATKYHGVIDAIVLGQRHIAPADVRWMNLLQVTLLTDSVWNNDQWRAFETWFKAHSMQPLEIFRRDPEVQTVDVIATLYCHARADLTKVRLAAEAAIKALFAPRVGILQTNIYLSDIYRVLEKADSSVEHFELIRPDKHVIVTLDSPEFTLTARLGGSITGGRRCYAVTARTSRGETTANFASISVDSSQSVAVRWEPVKGATSYRIYGGDPHNIGLLHEVTGSDGGEWVDTGGVTPRPVPAGYGNSLAPSYIKLGNLTINTRYTDRELTEVNVTAVV